MLWARIGILRGELNLVPSVHRSWGVGSGGVEVFHVKHCGSGMASGPGGRRVLRLVLWLSRIHWLLLMSVFHVKHRTYVLFHVKLEADPITPAT